MISEYDGSLKFSVTREEVINRFVLRGAIIPDCNRIGLPGETIGKFVRRNVVE